MSTEPDPAAAVARINDDLADLSTRLTEVSGDVADLAAALAAGPPETPTEQPPARPVPPPRTAPEPPTPESPTPESRITESPAPQPQLQYASGASTGHPVGPHFPHQRPGPQQPGPQQPNPQQYGPQQPGPQRPAAQPPGTQYVFPYPLPPHQPAARQSIRERLSAASEGGLIGKILAFTGVAITLIGVVLLLVLAAQAGLLRAEFRVAGGALLAAGLVGIGIWLGREERKRVGASAIVATGIAAALFTVLAAANFYHWLPLLAALILTGVITAAGFLIAARWENQVLGVTVGLGLIVFAPILSHGVSLTLVIFLLVYAAATLAVQIGRDWLALYIVNTVATVLPLTLLAAQTTVVPASEFVALLAVTLVLSAGSALLLLRTSSAPLVIALVALVPLLPILGSAPALGRTTTAVLLGAAAAGLAAMTLAGRSLPGIGTGVQTVWLTGTVVSGIAAIAVAGRGEGLTLALLGAALLLGAAAYYADKLADALAVLGTVALGLGLLTLAAPAIVALLQPNGLGRSDRVVLVAGALLAMGAVAALTWSWLHSGRDLAPHGLAVGAGLTGLVLFNVLCVGVGAILTDGEVSGFRAGHMCATIGFVAAGAAALMWARRLQAGQRTVVLAAGLAVLAVAVAKLFLFDLSALAGVFRVIAFIVVGLVLLGLGVAYAQSLSTAGAPASDDPPTGPIPVPAGAPMASHQR